MLPPQHRLRRSDEFRSVVRSGKRVGGRYVVLHVNTESTRVPRVGFVVSKAVGNAVMRNRVKRRLRHAVGELIPEFSTGADVVVRAHPRARSASFGELRSDMHRGLGKMGVLR